MNGRPVWLVSGSLRDFFGAPIPSARWSTADRELLERTLLDALDGVGDPTHERFFRMPVTACIYRRLTDEEEVGLHPNWKAAPAVHMAGGPLEILRETVPGSASTKPCLSPGKDFLGGRDRDLYLLRDCGECEPCLARRALETKPVGKVEA